MGISASPEGSPNKTGRTPHPPPTKPARRGEAVSRESKSEEEGESLVALGVLWVLPTLLVSGHVGLLAPRLLALLVVWLVGKLGRMLLCRVE